jgi:hypothetical protein
MREAQPGCEVPLHVVVTADRHREARGVYLSIDGGGGGGGGGGSGHAGRGGDGQRVEPSDSASKGGKAGGRNRWDCDGRSLCGEERNRDDVLRCGGRLVIEMMRGWGGGTDSFASFRKTEISYYIISTEQLRNTTQHLALRLISVLLGISLPSTPVSFISHSPP